LGHGGRGGGRKKILGNAVGKTWESESFGRATKTIAEGRSCTKETQVDGMGGGGKMKETLEAVVMGK